MKTKKISLVILVVMVTMLIFTALIGLTACNNNSKNLDMSYMEGLSIDLNNVTGLSINKDKLFDAQSCSDSDDDFFIYYSEGNVQTDESGIKQVTFKKNTTKTEKIIGPDGNEIKDDTIVHQEDIPAKLNRMYVSGNFMFVQYVLPYDDNSLSYFFEEKDNFNNPIKHVHYLIDVKGSQKNEDTIRPETLVYNEEGKSLFDKTSSYSNYSRRAYYSNFCSQSFVIDLKTGYIYKIKGISIIEIGDSGTVLAYKDSDYNSIGLLNDSNSKPKYYFTKINSNSELEFSRLVPNDNVEVREPIKDKYGYLIAPNNMFDEIDETNKIIYTTKYLYGDANGELCFSNEKYDSNPRYVYINGELKELSDNEMTVDCKYVCNFNNYVNFYKGKSINKLVDIKNYQSGSILYMYDLNTLIYENSDGNIYYKKVNLDECMNKQLQLDIADMKKITKTECKRYDVGVNTLPYLKKISNNQLMIVKDVYTAETLNGTKYYTLEMENDIPVLKLIENVTYQNDKFIFQPINK